MFWRPFSLACVVVMLIGAAGCAGGSAPTAQSQPANPAGAAPPAPLPPPPPPTAAAPGPESGFPAAAGEIPAWAGQRTDEPFDVKTFLASRAAPPDNAAPLYLTALAPISSELGGPSAAPLQREIGELADIEELAGGSVSPQQIDQVLAKAAPAISLIDEAQAKPRCVFVTGLSVDTLLPHVPAARTVTRLSLLQLQQARTKGDFASAEAAVNRSLRLSRDLQPRGTAVCQLVSIAMDGLLLNGIERIVLTDPQLSAEQCDRLIGTLLQHQREMLNRNDEGLKLEYVMCRNSIQDLQSGRLTLQELIDLGSNSNSTIDPQMATVLNFEAEIAACNKVFQLMLADAARPTARDATFSQVQQEFARQKAEIERFKSTLEATPQAERANLRGQAPAFLCLLLTPAVEAFAHADRRGAAQIACMEMLLALRRYELMHGSLPADLQAAAAESALKTVPLDAYDGQPLRFAIVGGKPTVYSVGKDLKDDGGQADWKFGQQPGDYLFVAPPRTP